MKYICEVCNWIYDEELGDPDNGIASGTKFEDLPDDFECPLCFVGKEEFSKLDQSIKLKTIAKGGLKGRFTLIKKGPRYFITIFDKIS